MTTTTTTTARPARKRAQRTAAILCRVSSKRQAAEDRSSLATQERVCREKAAEVGAAVDERYVARIAETASDAAARTHFEWLLQQADQHAFDVLLVDVTDRLTRGGMGDFFIIVDRLERADVELVLVREEYDGSEDSQLLVGVRAWMARKENKTRVRRMVDGKLGARPARGHPLVGSTPGYGYRWTDGTKTQRQFDDGESEAYQTVHRVWRYFLDDANPTLRACAHQLNAAGVRTPKQYFGRATAGRWDPTTVHRLLHWPVYWGGDADGMVETFKTSKHSAPLRVPTNAPAYVSREEAERVHARLVRNERFAPRRRTRDWAADGFLCYGGIARCPYCGWALQLHVYQRERADGSHYTVYRCAQRALFGPSRCQGVAIAADALDHAVVLAVHEHLGNTDYRHRLYATWDASAAAASQRVRDLDRQLQATHQRVQHATEYITAHGMADPLAPGIAAQARLAAESMPDLEARVGAARTAVDTARQDPAFRAELEAWLAAMTDGFFMLDTHRQRAYLTALGAEVRVWRTGDRTPRARLRLTVPTTVHILPAPFDVAAATAAYGDEAHVDTDGLFVDTDIGAEMAATVRAWADGIPDDATASPHGPIALDTSGCTRTGAGQFPPGRAGRRRSARKAARRHR